MAELKTDLTFQQANVLDLMKSHVKSLSEASDALDNKAQQNFSLSSIIVAIVGVLNLGLEDTDQIQQILVERPLFIGIFGVYALIVILSIIARLPKSVGTHPMTPTWKEAQTWLNLDLEKYYDKLLAAYVQIYEKNKSVVIWKSWLVWISNLLVALDVGLIFVEALKI
jgi:hypothetical protein